MLRIQDLTHNEKNDVLSAVYQTLEPALTGVTNLYSNSEGDIMMTTFKVEKTRLRGVMELAQVPTAS